MNIHRYNQIDINDINYLNPEKRGSSSYFGALSYNNGDHLKPLYIQTPKMKCLTNYSEIKDSRNPYLEVELIKGNYDIYDFFLSLDDKNIRTTYTNSKEWFHKELSLDAIDDMYKRTTKPFHKDKNPTLRFKLPVINNEISCTIYNQHRHFINIEDIQKGVEVILILHIRGLKFLKQYFLCDCYVSQMKLFHL